MRRRQLIMPNSYVAHGGGSGVSITLDTYDINDLVGGELDIDITGYDDVQITFRYDLNSVGDASMSVSPDGGTTERNSNVITAFMNSTSTSHSNTSGAQPLNGGGTSSDEQWATVMLYNCQDAFPTPFQINGKTPGAGGNRWGSFREAEAIDTVIIKPSTGVFDALPTVYVVGIAYNGSLTSTLTTYDNTDLTGSNEIDVDVSDSDQAFILIDDWDPTGTDIPAFTFINDSATERTSSGDYHLGWASTTSDVTTSTVGDVVLNNSSGGSCHGLVEIIGAGDASNFTVVRAVAGIDGNARAVGGVVDHKEKHDTVRMAYRANTALTSADMWVIKRSYSGTIQVHDLTTADLDGNDEYVLNTVDSIHTFFGLRNVSGDNSSSQLLLLFSDDASGSPRHTVYTEARWEAAGDGANDSATSAPFGWGGSSGSLYGAGSFHAIQPACPTIFSFQGVLNGEGGSRHGYSTDTAETEAAVFTIGVGDFDAFDVVAYVWKI